MEKTRSCLNFDGMIIVDCFGKFISGGLALLWKTQHEISLNSCSMNHIDVTVKVFYLIVIEDLLGYMGSLMIQKNIRHGSC